MSLKIMHTFQITALQLITTSLTSGYHYSVIGTNKLMDFYNDGMRSACDWIDPQN